jgi:hypothetical protein
MSQGSREGGQTDPAPVKSAAPPLEHGTPVPDPRRYAVGGHDTGVASALINTSQQVGASLGTALLNTVAAGATTTYLASHRVVPPPIKAALTHGYTQAFLGGACFLFVAALVAGTLINIGKAAVRESDSRPVADDPGPCASPVGRQIGSATSGPVARPLYARLAPHRQEELGNSTQLLTRFGAYALIRPTA